MKIYRVINIQKNLTKKGDRRLNRKMRTSVFRIVSSNGVVTLRGIKRKLRKNKNERVFHLFGTANMVYITSTVTTLI